MRLDNAGRDLVEEAQSFRQLTKNIFRDRKSQPGAGHVHLVFMLEHCATEAHRERALRDEYAMPLKQEHGQRPKVPSR